jgi:ribulose-phosphate 3-epimerase
MKKITIAAAILEKTYSGVEKKVLGARGSVDVMQVDICDGMFVPSKTFGSAGCESSFKRLSRLTKKDILELDMMVHLDSPIRGRFEKWLHAVKTAQPVQVIFHYGSTIRWDEVFAALKGTKIKVGLAVHLHHKNAEIFDMLKKYPFTYVQVMGIEKVGFGGQEFSSKTYAKIRAIRKKYPKLPIAVDGGVKVENAKKLAAAGATQLSSGSGLYKYSAGLDAAAALMRRA